MPDIKAAIARAKANGPSKVDVRQDHLTGKTVSKRSKTGNPACSAAMSAWKLGHGTPAVHAMLAKCRAQAAGRRQAMLARAGGNEARAQHLEHRSKQGMTGKERLAKAKELAEKRKDGRAAAGAGKAPESIKPNVRNVAAALRVNRQSIMSNRQHRVGPGDGRTVVEQNKDSRLGNTRRIVDGILQGRAKPEYTLKNDTLERAKRRLDMLDRRRTESSRQRRQAEHKEYVAGVYRRTAGIADERRAAHPPAQAEAPKLPTRTADTMSDAIAMSSPNGRMSKRAKAAATERLRVSLFGKEGLPQPSARQLSPTEADAQQAARLKELKEAKKRIKAGDARYDRLGVTGMANRGRARLERAARAAELRAKRKAKS